MTDEIKAPRRLPGERGQPESMRLPPRDHEKGRKIKL